MEQHDFVNDHKSTNVKLRVGSVVFNVTQVREGESNHRAQERGLRSDLSLAITLVFVHRVPTHMVAMIAKQLCGMYVS